MKYEYLKGSEKDFDGAERADDRCSWTHIYKSESGIFYSSKEIEHISSLRLIAERRPINEPELKPIYGDGIHDDSEALQQRIDMGIDIKPILNNGVFLTLKPLQFKPITDQAWSGKGFPPVGTKVDIISDVGDSIVFEGSLTGEVIAHVEDNAVVRMAWGLACFKVDRLLPSRSPEDVARDEAIKAMRDVGYTLPAAIRFTKEEMAALYDAGYRKQ